MIGPTHLAGSVMRSTIMALPDGVSATDLVVAAAVAELPQNSAASTAVTGPTVSSAELLVPVIRRPLIATAIRPLDSTVAAPNFSFQGTWPGAIAPWILSS